MRLSAPAHSRTLAGPYLRTLVMLCLFVSSACGGALKPEYEYEEELYLRLDGSATVNINASVAALAARLAGEPIEIEVQMEPESILYSTLILFGMTIVAAALTFAVVIWMVARRGHP